MINTTVDKSSLCLHEKMQQDKLPAIKEKRRKDEDDEPGEKWVARNWTKKDTKGMSLAEKSRYLAYEEPPKEVSESQAEAKKRLRELKKRILKEQEMYTLEEEIQERNKQERLIGQLKAAEARDRIRIMRLRYEANRGQEINHLIACQPTARKAVRLQALIPTKNPYKLTNEGLDKISRARVECLLDDVQGLITGRT